MSDTAVFDQEAYRIAVASVRRHSMDINSWKHTVVGALHSDIAGSLELSQGEQVIASGFLSKENWWAVTTRQVATKFQGVVSSIDPRFGVESEFGNFKGIKRSEAPEAAETEVATVKLSNGEAQVRFEFETGKASMAPIYACMFWSRASRYHYGSGGA